MARKVTHYLRQGCGCPECGEHRMHKLHSCTAEAEVVNGKQKYQWAYRCVTCGHVYVPPPTSELPPIAQEPLHNLIKGVLYYADEASGASVDRARGVVLGVVTTLMEERGIPLEKAMVLIYDALPNRYRPETIPGAWQELMEEEA